MELTTAEPERDIAAQAVYYAGWIAMLLLEAVLWSVLGAVIGTIAFILGGVCWGWWQAAQTTPGERLRGPILGWTRRLLEREGTVAFVGAVLLGGAPGVGAAAVSSGRRDAHRKIVVASVVYALVFVTFHMLRPSEGLPMHFGPRL